MERFELNSYDPFPLNVGETRTLGDFTFGYSKEKKQGKSYYSGRPAAHYYEYSFSIERGSEKRVSRISLGWTARNDGKEDLEFLKRLLIERRRYTKRATLYAFQKEKPVGRYGYHRYGRKNKTKIEITSSDYLTCIPSGLGWLNTNDEFMVELNKVLEEDNKAWRLQRKEKRDDGVLVKGKLNDVEDTIRTKEIMRLMPLLTDLESTLSSLLSKGNNYTKTQAQDVIDAFNKLNNGQHSLRTLKKHGKK